MTDRLHRHDAVSSTQDFVHALGAAGARHGEAVVAVEQGEGRGARGRTWWSPPGGLWLSVLWRPSGNELGPLSLRIGLAAAAAIERVVPAARVALKWPNDLYLADRKLGGILCEARWPGDADPWAAIGLGINVRNSVPGETAVALAEVAPEVTPDALLPDIVAGIRALSPGAAELTSEELAAFGARDWLRGRRLERPVAGIADGVAPDGTLRVRTPDGALAIARDGGVRLAESTADAPDAPDAPDARVHRAPET